ncbi:MAG TPA: hypothetical protein VGI58_05970 [Streptosporangiaceae bacterium]|jgi:hypothetical protein
MTGAAPRPAAAASPPHGLAVVVAHWGGQEAGMVAAPAPWRWIALPDLFVAGTP